MEPLAEIANILSEDSHLIKNRLKFVHSLGITETKVASLMTLFAMGQCQPYDFVHYILSEWIVKRKNSATVKELRRILSGIHFNRCSEKLKELEEMYPGPIKIPGVRKSSECEFIFPQSTGNPPSRETTSIAFGVKDVVVNFMGRDEELKRLNEYFHSRNCRSVLLSGLGGIGKTELAKKFTLDISDPSGSIKIVKSWLAGESPQTLLKSTTEFCHHLRLSATSSDGQPLRIQDMLKNILTKLKSTAELSRWLVIIDNVDEIHQEFQTALKTLFDFGSFVFLVVTSRRRDVSTGELLQVTEFKLLDSIKFIKNSLRTEDSSENAILELCNQLGNFPLALSQSVAYIKEQQRQTLIGTAYGVQNYLDELAKKESLGLDNDLEYAEYPKAALKVWNLTLDKIEGDQGTEGGMALNLLDVMAFIIPDNIQIPFLHKLFKRFYKIEENDQEQIHSFLKILLQYSLISSYNSLISIHRMVQLSLRERMTSKSSQITQRRDIEILKSFWKSFNSKEWNKNDMPNILKIWKHSCRHPDLYEQIAIKSYVLSVQLDDLGMVNESYDFATECSKFLLNLFGPENKEYLLMEERLAIAMREKGQFKSSLEKLTFVYGKLKEHCGEDHEKTLRTGHWIAIVLFDLERHKESLEWGQKILQSRIRIYGEKSEFTMNTKHNLALTLQKSGKRVEALEMYKEILEWQEVHLGEFHSSTLTTRQNIGVCSYSAGKYAEARDIFQNLLSLHEVHLGIEHPHTHNTKAWLADTLHKMGEIDEALKAWEEVAVAREKVFGPDHPSTVYARNNVTFLKNKQSLEQNKNKTSVKKCYIS